MRRFTPGQPVRETLDHFIASAAETLAVVDNADDRRGKAISARPLPYAAIIANSKPDTAKNSATMSCSNCIMPRPAVDLHC
jgi:hypothetical protein